MLVVAAVWSLPDASMALGQFLVTPPPPPVLLLLFVVLVFPPSAVPTATLPFCHKHQLGFRPQLQTR